MSRSTSSVLDVHLRAFAERTGTNARRGPYRHNRPQRPGWAPPPGQREILVFDAETTTDTEQRLTFGVWRLCREILDPAGRFLRLAVREEGIIYADNLPESDPEAFATLTEYARCHEPSIDADRHHVEPVMDCTAAIVLAPRSWFVEERLFKAAYKAKAPVVGFNLKFDLSRLAAGWAPSKSGGITLYTHMIPAAPGRAGRPGRQRGNPYRPAIHIKPIDGHRALVHFGVRTKPDRGDAGEDGRAWRGEFVDLYALTLGLTGSKHNLKSAGEAMDCDTVKIDAPEHGLVTPDYIDYARHDVAATHDLYEHCRRELERHPIDLPAHRVLSPAGVGKSYLAKIGVRPRLHAQPDFDRKILGAATSSYYGGRVEAQVIGASPIRYYDVLSMYPTVNALLGLWELGTAARVQATEATSQVRALLRSITPDALESPDTWGSFAGIAKLAKDSRHSPVVPIRANYTPGAPNIGLNELADSHDGWYAIPDLIASKLYTGRTPRITQAVIFTPRGRQQLTPVRLRGEIPIDPGRDFFAQLIEQRQLCKRRGDDVNATQLKITANGTGYGINMEMLRDETALTAIDVHTASGSFTTATETPEEPRGYCFPPIATLITAGARLILAMIEHRVKEAGGVIAYMDTDSVAIVSTPDGGLHPCPGGTEKTADGRDAVRALSYHETEAIAGRFATLNPYDPKIVGGSILELEKENTPPSGCEEQLYIYAISAKSYAMYHLSEDGRVVVRKFSEHGLGMRLDPTAAGTREAESDRGNAMEEDCAGRPWIRDLWRYLIQRHALNRHVPEPDWFDLPALSQLSITRPEIAERLGLSPFNFCLVAQTQLGYDGVRLIAPMERDPRRWTRMKWTDVNTGDRYKIACDPKKVHDTDPTIIYVKTYREVAAQLLARGESKLQTPDGRPGPRGYRGLLLRRRITPGETQNIGKESNRIEDTQAGLISAEDALNKYRPERRRDQFDELARPVIERFTIAHVRRTSTLPERTIRRIQSGAHPAPATAAKLTTAAHQLTGEALRANEQAPPPETRPRLLAWAKLPHDQQALITRVCPGCRKPLAGSIRGSYHSEACRSAARRETAARTGPKLPGLVPAAELRRHEEVDRPRAALSVARDRLR